jgi:hypothetical protein
MLTLRSTGLASPAYANWLDYVIVEAGRTVGRLLRNSPHNLQLVLPSLAA